MIKELVVASTLVLVVGCSNTPSKLQRIEALEGSSASQQTQIDANSEAIDVNSAAIIDTNIKIDRMFEKAQYK
jgi:hypothetical protein